MVSHDSHPAVATSRAAFLVWRSSVERVLSELIRCQNERSIVLANRVLLVNFVLPMDITI